MAKSLKQTIFSVTLFSSIVLGGSYLSYTSYNKHSALELSSQDVVLRSDMDSLKTRITYIVEEAPLSEENLFKDLKKSVHLYKACKLSDNYTSLQEKIDYEKNPSKFGEWAGIGLLAMGLIGLYTLTIKDDNILPEPEETDSK